MAQRALALIACVLSSAWLAAALSQEYDVRADVGHRQLPARVPVRRQHSSSTANPLSAKAPSGLSRLARPSNWTAWAEACANEHVQKPVGRFNPLMPNYRLGDCIKLQICKTCRAFPGSIGDEYAARTKKKNDFNVLLDILRKRSNRSGYVTPDPESFVVHLRLGDSVELSKASSKEMLMKGATSYWVGRKPVTSIKSVEEYIVEADAAGASRVDIVGGTQRRMLETKSRVYATCLHRAFDLAGYTTTMQYDGDADKAFYFMTHASKVSVSSGGFSRIIGKLVSEQGGTVVGRSFLYAKEKCRVCSFSSLLEAPPSMGGDDADYSDEWVVATPSED